MNFFPAAGRVLRNHKEVEEMYDRAISYGFFGFLLSLAFYILFNIGELWSIGLSVVLVLLVDYASRYCWIEYRWALDEGDIVSGLCLRINIPGGRGR